jgi:nucleotide-binding universal stress UspA family protein
MLPRDVGNGSRVSASTYPVVVGVDGSFGAIRAARWAASVAECFASPLLIVYAGPPLGQRSSDDFADHRAAETTIHRESAEAILASAEHAVRVHFKDLRITTARVDGPTDRALVDLSRSARLIVLGSDEMTFGRAILIGSTTTAVATHSTCPVVAWRGDATAPTRLPIVLGVDHDHDSRVAVTAAFEFAHRLGVGLLAVHAFSMRRPAGEVALPYMIDWHQVERDARRHISDVISPWVELYPDVEVSSIVEADKPSRALLRCSQDAQLIVVGSRGRGLLAGVLLGSTGLNLLHHSEVPVMVCRSAETDDYSSDQT